LSADGILTFTLNGIQNPLASGEYTFTVQTYLDFGDPTSKVDLAVMEVTITSVATAPIAIKSNSDVVLNYPTTLTFTAINTNIIPPNSQFRINIPDIFEADSPTCTIGTLGVPCSYNSTTQLLIIAPISNSQIAAG
jgi:hypothetical protein